MLFKLEKNRLFNMAESDSKEINPSVLGEKECTGEKQRTNLELDGCGWKATAVKGRSRRGFGNRHSVEKKRNREC